MTLEPKMMNKNLKTAQILVISLFFFWAIAHNLNDVLITQFQKALDLNRGQAGFIQFAFYLGYFIMALPAGMVIKKLSYKKGIILGLLLYALGAFIFFPAAEVRVYGMFLGALFIIASGLTFLETAANPYITVLGDPNTSEQRLNFAQAFNGLGAVTAPLIGGAFIFTGTEYSLEDLNNLDEQALELFRISEAQAVQMPYLIIGIVILIVAFFFYKSPMPDVIAEEQEPSKFNLSRLMKYKNLRFGIFTQFFYVGAQVGIWSYFIDYMIELLPATAERTAAYYLSICLLLFMLGRFIGALLMGRFKPARLMGWYAIGSMVFLVVAIFGEGALAVYALMGVSFFMSIMFPTIFALSIKGLGEDTKMGSSLVIMAIIGGAIFPLLMGYLAIENIQYALFLPFISFIVVMFFAFTVEKTIPQKITNHV